MTISEVYNNTVKPLPVADRLRLAALILNDIPRTSIVDESSEWSDEDLADFAAHAARGADERDQPSGRSDALTR